MSSRETFLLRTKLRQVNMEYSALVRDRTSERRFVRMDELRIERWSLMNLLFCGADSKRRRRYVGRALRVPVLDRAGNGRHVCDDGGVQQPQDCADSRSAGAR